LAMGSVRFHVTGSPPTCRVRASAPGATGRRPLMETCSTVTRTTQPTTMTRMKRMLGERFITAPQFTTFAILAARETSMKPLRLVVVLACLLGIPAGVGAFTFVYAKGYSYLSTDPRTCLNCHVMRQEYEGWLKSGHRHTATCVECHLPHGGLGKWVAKADQGFRHSLAFTLQNFHEPIRIIPRDRQIVRLNCVRCHEAFVHA